MSDVIAALMEAIDGRRIGEHVHYLAHDPLPFRKVNYTRPGQSKCSLDEADDYLQAQLLSYGLLTEKEPVAVQAFRCDVSKPKAHQYSPPMPEDPWYTAYNVYGKKIGNDIPEEIIVVISHKDSQSWVDSPGANDNAVGTAVNLEIARVLADYSSRRTLWFIYCNEEHTPWTSITAAQNARERGDNIVAVFNLDGVGRKSQEEHDAGVMANATVYTTPEGERLADLMAQVNEEYALGLRQTKHLRAAPGDDDGSFVKAGYGAAIGNIGSYPYGDPEYHTERDTAERVDVENALVTAKAALAAIVKIDQQG
jgi:hypothetical protein